jgi:DNA-binding PadR family transcriptional regulator
MKTLTLFEQIILASIVTLKDEAFGVSIRKKAKQISGKSIMYGALYNVLDQLYRKGLVTKVKKTPSPLESGHTRIYYTATPEGLGALQQAYALQKSIWANLPDLTEGL